MSDSPLRDKSFAFAVRMVNLYKFLTSEKKEYVLSKQLLRSGTAIGAMVWESSQAESRADFIHKLSIALKEANESDYWLLLLYKTEYLQTSEFDSLYADIKELLKILTSIINTTKRKRVYFLQ